MPHRPRRGGFPRLGRRSDHRGLIPSGSPFDFGVEDDALLDDDPGELLAMRADDALLDVLAAGGLPRPALSGGLAADDDLGYRDEQQLLAMLAALRAEVDSEPLPELISVDAARAAIAAGQRSTRPRRRLMPVAAAAAVVVLGLSAVGIAATHAQPGDPLWGVSRVIDGSRASSVQAAYQVDLTLGAAQQALAQGHVSDAQRLITTVGPQLGQIQDTQRKDALARKSANLLNAAAQTPEGQSVDTDEHGIVRDRTDRGDTAGAQPGHQGPQDRGPRDQGPQDRGPRDQGPQDRGPRDQGPQDRGPRDQGPQDRQGRQGPGGGRGGR
jgi:hypothetical protein